jgi:membrane-bound lytic murein transglycosylase D
LRSTALTLFVALVLGACATPNPESAQAPQGLAAPAPPADAAVVVKPPEPLEPFTPAAMAELEPLPMPTLDLWDRIVDGYGIPDLVDDPLVAKWEQYYASRPDYVARMVDRSRRYLYHIVSATSARGMPLDLVLLPMVESAYNPTALSTSRASGIWQFVPSTGKTYGLKQDFWVDSRRDVIAATDSALDYLETLYVRFGDWQLALAAYNWGEGNVQREVDRNLQKGLPAGFADLTRLPAETRNYLPKLQAVKNIIRDPGKYGLSIDDIPDAPYFAVVKTTRKMDVQRAADLAEMPLEEFEMLNPQHNRPVIAGADEYTILLPIDKAEVFAAKLELTDQPLVSWQAYRMKGNETLAQVAARYGLSVDTLRAVNGIGPRARVPAGFALLVPAESPSDVTLASLSQTVFTTVPQGRTVYYKVRKGDTLAGIARRYHVSVAEIRSANALPKNSVQAGQRLRIVVESASGESVASRSRPRGTQPKAAVRQTKAAADHGHSSKTRKASAAPAKTSAQAKGKRDKPVVQATANGGAS